MNATFARYHHANTMEVGRVGYTKQRLCITSAFRLVVFGVGLGLAIACMLAIFLSFL